MTEKEIFTACCGTNQKGFPKAAIFFSIGLLDFSGPTDQASYEEFDEMMTQSAIVNIERTLYHTKIELTFEDASEELKKLWKKIMDFRAFVEKADLPETKISNTILTIESTENEDYVVQASYGIYSLTGTDPEKPCDTITFIYANEFVRCLQLKETE